MLPAEKAVCASACICKEAESTKDNFVNFYPARRPIERLLINNSRRGAQLEQKLDSIVHLLAAQNTLPSSSSKEYQSAEDQTSESAPTDPMQTDDDEQPPSSFRSPSPHALASQRMQSNNPPSWRREVTSTTDGSVPTHPKPSGRIETTNAPLSPHETRSLVESWRPQLMAHFPFVVIDPTETTEEVVVKSPFLSKSIAVAALFGDLPRQLGLAQELIKELSTEMIVRGQKVNRTCAHVVSSCH